MISIQYQRFGPIVIAATVNDNRDITMTWGLTENHATDRLINKLG